MDKMCANLSIFRLESVYCHYIYLKMNQLNKPESASIVIELFYSGRTLAILFCCPDR